MWGSGGLGVAIHARSNREAARQWADGTIAVVLAVFGSLTRQTGQGPDVDDRQIVGTTFADCQ